MYVAPPAATAGHVLEGTDAELDVEDEEEENDDDEEDVDVELDVGRRLLDVLLESIEVDVDGLLLEEVVRMRLLDVLLDDSELVKECGFVKLLGMGSRESLECRWIVVKLSLRLELVERGSIYEWLECRRLYVTLDDACNVDGMNVGVVISGIVTIAYD